MKIYQQVFLGIICLASFNLFGAFGCQYTPYTPDSYDVTNPQPQSCNCSCMHILDDKGTCQACGHYGNPDRGIITKKILDELGLSMR